MNSSHTFLAFLLMLCAVPVWGQEFKKTATAGFVFLEVPATARHAALGEATVALADVGSEGVFLNPAAVGFLGGHHAFSVSYAPWMADTKHYASSYAFNSPLGVFAAGAIYFDFGTMQRTQRSAGQRVYEVTGEFSANAMAVGLTYAKKLTEQFAFGVTVKYVREGIDTYSASNLLFDGGVLYYTGLGSLRLGAGIQNFGTEVKYKNDPFKMPAMLRLGLSADVIGDAAAELRVTSCVEALHPSDGDEKINVGLEICWRNFFAVRSGYKFLYDEETYSLGAGVGAGGGFPIGADFAFSDYGRLGTIVRFTVRMELH